ncbi:MAG: DNA repair protein RadC [Prevotellaceae bacterium]|jgi:DNA repair protein RadC|nr:DNA repair protein RadC [Prevotellaceae bacterium]
MPETRRLTIREWAKDDRPREKMLLKGANALSDAELLAILIASGNAKETAVELARRILHGAADNLNELANITVSELCKLYKGIGQAKAITIVAAMELGRRRKAAGFLQRQKFIFSKDAADFFTPYLADLRQEECWAAFLDHKLQLIDFKKIAQGGKFSTIIDIKFLLKSAIEKSAFGVVVAHNHLSNNAEPSDEDFAVTEKIANACKILEIKFIDHVIIARGAYYSFADNNFVN